MLDNRLKKCAELVSGKGIAADVGTDHALLAAELIQSGKCEKVIASDIKEGPLESAARTVEKYGLSDKIDLILSNGLENVPLEGVTDIVIAGMGGENIAEIISGESRIGSDSYVRLILQPMSKPEFLRKQLYCNGFVITSESVIEDGDKLYIVMTAEPSDDGEKLTETEAFYGFFDDDDPLAQKYRKREAERLAKIAENLEKGGKHDESVHFKAMSCRMVNGSDSVKISELYDFLDSVYPFDLQEKWDNSGLLVENTTMTCRHILLSLDITIQSVLEAEEKGSDLIISHHPVIFEPRRSISRRDPVYRLVCGDIAAICMHTNVDIAAGGTNGVILKKLAEKLEFSGAPEPFEELGANNLGWIIDLKEIVSAEQLAKICKEIFGCEYVRLTKYGSKNISRIAFCSGSGGSMLGLALEKNCDALITGDVKHDVWIEANNRNITLLDCGHFHTENPVLWELRRVIEEKFPQLDVEIAESSTDPCIYL